MLRILPHQAQLLAAGCSGQVHAVSADGQPTERKLILAVSSRGQGLRRTRHAAQRIGNKIGEGTSPAAGIQGGSSRGGQTALK